MILKKILILGFVFLSNVLLISQNEVCTSSSSEEGDLFAELNTINKCLVEKKVYTSRRRNRYVRSRANNYVNTIKNNISSLSTDNTTTYPEEIKPEYVYLSKVTEEPVLMSSSTNSEHKGNLEEVLKNYISENLASLSVIKDKGIEGNVWVSFIIDKKGDVKNIVASGPIGGEVLETEVLRLIKKLPKFSPGKLNGEYVNVKHLMTIDFKLDK